MQRLLDWLGLPLFPSRSRRRRATAPRRAASHGRRLLVEELESRLTPSTVHIGGTHGQPIFITADGGCSVVVDYQGNGLNSSVVIQGTNGTKVEYTDPVGNGKFVTLMDNPFTSIDNSAPIIINEIAGNNVFHILGNRGAVSIAAGPGDQVFLGNGTLQNIQGPVTLTSPFSSASLEVDDQVDPAPHVLVLGSSGPYGTISGLETPPINYQLAGTDSVTVRTGPGTSVVDVSSTSVNTNVISSAPVTVDVGLGSTSGILGRLNLSNTAASDRIVVDDNTDATPAAAMLSTGTGDGSRGAITGLAPAVITFDTGRTASVALDFGTTGHDTLKVDGSNDPTYRTVNLNTGMDLPFFSRYFGPFGIISGLTHAVISYHGAFDAVALHTGTGGATVNVLNTGIAGLAMPLAPLTVVGHSSLAVNVGSQGSAQGILGSITVTNTPGAFTSLNVDDSTDPTDRTASLDTVAYLRIFGTYGTITGLAPASISYRTSVLNNLTVQTGTGAETVDVLATAVPVTLIGHSGNTTVNLGNYSSLGRIAADVTVDGATSLVVDDAADPVNHTATLSQRSYYDANRFRHSLGTIDGLAPAHIAYDAAVNTLLLATGTGIETVNVQSLTVPNAWMMAHSNSTTIDLGDAGTVKSLHTALHIDGGPTTTGALAHPHIVIDDSVDPGRPTISMVPVRVLNNGPFGPRAMRLPRYFTMPNERVTGFPGLTIWTGAYADQSSMVVKTGPGGATITAAAIIPITLAADPSASNTLSSGGVWTLSGLNAGSIGLLSFTGFANLTGTGGDTFVFANGAAVSGALDGAGGNDTLDYTNYGDNVAVNLQTLLATGVGRLAGTFGMVIGANGGGAEGRSNILVGNGGATLVGGVGRRNLLIAGPQAARLVAGDQGDILIAGDTAYDQQSGMAALRTIMAEWPRTDQSYATRVQVITQGTVTPPLTALVVQSNGGHNQLQDPSGLDWLFVQANTDGYTAFPSEQVVTL